MGRRARPRAGFLQRNNKGSDPFYVPDYSTVSDSGVVSIVGLSGLNKVILQVAGADGLFVA